MTSLRLGLTLSVVGARRDLLEKETWPMALRVAIGTDDYAGTADAAADLIMPTLPWVVWPDALPEVIVADQTGTEIARCRPALPLTENAPFLEALRSTVLARGRALARDGRLTFSFGGEHKEIQDNDTRPAVSWPGLMSTLNTLAQPTPSALKSTWFFNIDRALIAALGADGKWQLKPGMAISAAPASIVRAVYTGTQVGPDRTHVHSYGAADVVAHCQLFELEGALDHGLDELDNYWLSIRDSRDHSLLDLAARVETALGPAAMVGAVSIDEWTEACVTERDDGSARPATMGETKAVLDSWRRWISKREPEETAKYVANQRRVLLQKALYSEDDTEQAIRQGYAEQAGATLARLQDVAQQGIRTTVRSEAMESLLNKLRDRLLPAFAKRSPSPCQPGEGIELLLGDERMRLRHEDQPSGPVDEIAAIQLFGRRTSAASAFDDDDKSAGWHSLSGGHYAVPTLNDGKTLQGSTDRVFGVTAGYVDGVLYRELPYYGANLVCRNPMERVHRETLSELDEAGMMLAQVQRHTSPAWELRALPLRYGDHYEFAASVIDRAGGQATELCEVDKPWAFDPQSISRLAPPQKDRVHFLRRVAVGHCNVLPPSGEQPQTPGVLPPAGEWPQTPADVWLRCLEEAPPPAENVQKPTSLLLVPAGKEFRARKVGSKEVPWPASVSFNVEAPRVDEHTLLRWNMPATTLPAEAQHSAVEALKTALTAIYGSRDSLLADGGPSPASGLPIDPAVTALGVRYRFDGQDVEQLVVAGPAVAITIDCGNTDLPPPPRKEGDPAALRFVLAPGSHVMLGFVPLIARADFERMDEEALSGLLEHEPWIATDGTMYRAFAESVVFAESATSDLPDLKADDLLLGADSAGNVEVRYAFSRLDDTGRRRLRHVHQMRISCERWVWRNLPVPAENPADPTTSSAERRRRLASGPPAEILDAARRDLPGSEIVSYYDKLASIDQGFVRREEVFLRFPRDRSDEIALHVDQRDGVTPADYLRYRLSLRSRYQGVLVERDTQPVGPRRIALPFRGDAARIKPPKVLAVLPLVRAIDERANPRPDEKGAGFLVILDEPWFREYGIGERLRARIAHVKAEVDVKAEVGETTEPPERRYGPLPDHSVVPRVVADEALAEDLDCFGPFGFSLDRGSSQALANATGFVVYPPAGTPAHYNLFVEFSRLLDIPSGVSPDGTRVALESARSDALPLYTLPDSDDLYPGKKEGTLEITSLGKGEFSFDPSAVGSAPFVGATGEVLRQYRYLMIVGRLVRDGGRAVDVFLPADGLWLDGDKLRLLGKVERDISRFDHAVIAEVLLNGRPGEADPLGAATTLREFFLKLFVANADDLPGKVPAEDAPGMIRRFSEVFKIAFGHDGAT